MVLPMNFSISLVALPCPNIAHTITSKVLLIATQPLPFDFLFTIILHPLIDINVN